MPAPPPLDTATLLVIIGRVEHHLVELDRRTAECSLCHSADPQRHLGELRQLLTARSGTTEATGRIPMGANSGHG
jgi:hypothetical protein